MSGAQRSLSAQKQGRHRQTVAFHPQRLVSRRAAMSAGTSAGVGARVERRRGFSRPTLSHGRPRLEQVEYAAVLEEHLLAAKAERPLACRAVALRLDDLDDRRFVGKRWGRGLDPDPRCCAVEQAAYRPPVGNQRRRSAERAAASFRLGEDFERMALGQESGLGFRGAGSARKRADGGSQANKVEPLALERVSGAAKPLLRPGLSAHSSSDCSIRPG